MTRAAPRWSRQSANPPVEAPMSRQSRPATSRRSVSRAWLSFSPPRETKRGGTSTATSTESSTWVPGFSKPGTRPASTSACACVRLSARPRSTSRTSSRFFTAPRLPSRSRRAPAESRSPHRRHRPLTPSRAPRAHARAGRAAPPRAAANPDLSCDGLPRNSGENAVDETRRLVGRIALRKLDRLVDRDVVGHLVAVELVHRDSEDVPLDCAKAFGGPPGRCPADPPVELLHLRRDALRGLPCEGVHLALVQRGQRLPRHVPLVEEQQRGPPRRAAPRHYAGTSNAIGADSSRKLVEYRPEPKASPRRIAIESSRVVGMPTISSSPSARMPLAIAPARSSSHTITFPSSES